MFILQSKERINSAELKNIHIIKFDGPEQGKTNKIKTCSGGFHSGQKWRFLDFSLNGQIVISSKFKYFPLHKLYQLGCQ